MAPNAICNLHINPTPPNPGQWTPASAAMTSEQDNGQCFVAVDPSCFAPGFEGRMQDLMGHVRSMEPAKEGDKVLVRHPVMIQMFISDVKHPEDCTRLQ